MLVKRVALSLLLMLAMVAETAWAHPMGNFSVNHLSKIELQNEKVSIRYFIDLAEIPTFQELQQGSIQANTSDAAVARYIAARGAEFGRGLQLVVDGNVLGLKLISSEVLFPPGAGGLPTMKMGFAYEASYPPGLDRSHIELQFADRNYPGHSGWKEITAEASVGTMLESSVPRTDRSAALTNYPTDLLNSPPQDLEASLVAALPAVGLETAQRRANVAINALPLQPKAKATHISTRPANAAGNATGAGFDPHVYHPGARPAVSDMRSTQDIPAVVLKPNQQLTPRNRFTELITAQELNPWFLFTAAFIAIGLGALHALEPGHGKTIVAAYLVGSRGTARHATLLGIIVTVSHTAGVFALGAVTLFASRYIVPEQLYPWLGVFSGITITGLGGYLFLRRLTGTATDHSHANGESHFGWLLSMLKIRRRREAGVQAPIAQGPVSLVQLFTLGITSGIIPCPAALIVLLSAFALHRIGLGFFLIVAFSAGLAAVLIGFGLLMVYARRFMARLQMDGPLTTRWLPLASSAFILVLGLVLTVQAYSATHLSLFTVSRERIGPLLLVTGLGLILGVRHSTDADHVVAISTIVSKQRSIRNAALIGSVWGLGHTITIFAVGSLIILCGVEIPPRLGLSMEFSVALMLILLGILNLTGVMKKVTVIFTPAFAGSSDSSAAKGNQVLGGTATGLGSAVKRLGVYQFLRPLVIGLVHGLAGSAAVALLVLSTIHNPIWATIYLLIFGAGTMVGMMTMTAAIAVPLAFAGDRFIKLGHYFGLASGMVSLCFGSFLVYQLGFLGGLFTSHPQWIPR